MRALYQSFGYYSAKQPTSPTLTSYFPIPLYSPQWVKGRPKLSAASSALSLCFAVPFTPDVMVQKFAEGNSSSRIDCTLQERYLALAEDLAFMPLAIVFPIHKMRPIHNSPSKTFQKKEKQDGVHNFHAKSQPACLLAAANTPYSCWWWHRTSSPALMLRYVSLSRSSVGDSLLACGNSWNCFFRLTLQGLWRLQEAEL